MIFKSDTARGDLNGFLDRGSHLSGELRFENAFRVDGSIDGAVVSEGDLVVGDHGEVQGEIRVGQLFVSGTVRGTVEAAQRVHIAPGGKLFADIHTPTLVVEDGATYDGRCSMSRKRLPEAADAQGPKLLAPVPGTKAVPSVRSKNAGKD